MVTATEPAERELSPEEFEAACREVGQQVADAFKGVVGEVAKHAEGGQPPQQQSPEATK